MKKLIFIYLLVLMVCGCARMSTSPSYMSSPDYQARPAATGSLFTGDEAVLGGATIEQILNSKVAIPKKARLAVLKFGQPRAWQWWSEDFALMDEDIEKGFTAKLQRCTRLADVSLLPSLMTPEKQTIPYLREAAARYQADLLLVYRSASRSYDKYRAFSPDEVKAKCVVEAILIDVRTGIVPFSSVSAQEYVGKKSKQDYSFSETITRAEMKAVSEALDKTGSDLVKFLETVP